MCSAAVIGIYMTRHQNDQVSPIEEAVLLIQVILADSPLLLPPPPTNKQKNPNNTNTITKPNKQKIKPKQPPPETKNQIKNTQ